MRPASPPFGRGLALALSLAGAVVLVAAVPALADDDYQLGVELLDQGRWAEALPIYQRITRENPAHPWAWLGLGWSLHYTGEPQAAIPAYERAIELGAQPPHRMLTEIARCHAALGRPEEALASLERALAAGLPSPQRLGSDDRLESLRPLPAFRRMLGLLDSAGVGRDRGWRHDLQLLGREVKRVHAAPFRRITEAEFDRRLTALQDSIGALDDDRLGVRVMALVAALGDGHTWAEAPYQQRARLEALPLLIGQFDDGLFVTGTLRENEDLLWAEVIEVQGVPVAEALARIEPLVARDNPMGVLALAAQRLRYPRLLRALGLGTSPTQARFRIRDRRGRVRHVRLTARSSEPDAWVRRPAGHRGPLPLYAIRRGEPYWFQVLPDSATLYLQYNVCTDADSESVERFAQRLLQAAGDPDLKRMVVDLRYNTGGNLFRNPPLLEAIVQSRELNRTGKLFVVVSRYTFSAGMSFAAHLERFTHAIFAGEPSGSSPNFVGETNVSMLPYSGIRVSLSNLAWQNSHAMDHRIWIAPRIPVRWTFASYREGRDPVLEAILRF